VSKGFEKDLLHWKRFRDGAAHMLDRTYRKDRRRKDSLTSATEYGYDTHTLA
jgi:hypothetical protein